MARTGAEHRLTGVIALALAIFLLGALAGYLAVDDSWARGTLGEPAAQTAGSFRAILTTIVGAALLLYSGALTLGSTTVVALVLLAVYVGATCKVGVVASGWSDLVDQVGLYAPVEFLGLVAVAAAGLHPLVAAVHRPPSGSSLPASACSRYLCAVPRSLALLLIGLCLVLTAAAVEALLIRHM